MIKISDLELVESRLGEPLCLSLANTVSYRRREDRTDTLAEPRGLKQWLLASGVAEGVLGLASTQDLERVRTLRESVYGVLSAESAGRQPSGHDSAELAAALHSALGSIEWRPDHPEHCRLTTKAPIDRAIQLAALSAVSLLASEHAGRLRECANDECGWLFVDHSKNGSRKWCSMSDCGNVAKARRFYARHKGK